VSKPTIRELLDATKLETGVERDWWSRRCADDHCVDLDHKDEIEAAERVLAAGLLAERVEKVIALHVQFSAIGPSRCSECSNDWPCATVLALDGE